jgi:Protein of unknown function (DUF2490)
MKIIIIIIINFSLQVFAQNEIGTWNVVNLNVKINPKWNVFTESQLRSLSFYDTFHYYEYKVGGTYKVNSNFSGTIGVGSYNTYSDGGNFMSPAQNRETRTWLQVNMKNPLEFVTFEHRYRAEQRMTSNGYKNRFRYRIAAIIPINQKTIKPKTAYISLWNEIFFTNNEPFFERNRVFIGGGYEFSKQIAMQLGYIHQFDYKINDESGRDFINIALLYNIDLTQKNNKDYSPIAPD